MVSEESKWPGGLAEFAMAVREAETTGKVDERLVSIHHDHRVEKLPHESEKGIDVVYCLDCASAIYYLFDPAHWTLEQAQEWCDKLACI